MQIRGKRSDNKSGYTGVYIRQLKNNKVYVSQIKQYGRNMCLGMFETAKEASDVYLKERDKMIKENRTSKN